MRRLIFVFWCLIFVGSFLISGRAAGVVRGSASIEGRISDIIGDRCVGVAVVDMYGREVVVGDSGLFACGGFRKFVEAVEIARRYDFASLVDSVFEVGGDDLRGGVWSPLRAMADSLPMSMRPVELLEFSLLMNDENASGVLLRRMLPDVAADAGLLPSEMSALDAARFMHGFFYCDTVASATLVKAVLGRGSVFGNERIVAGVPGGAARVFHKSGTYMPDSGRGRVAGDVAMIFYPMSMGYGCYSLAVFCRDDELPADEVDGLIAAVSEALWRDVIVSESAAVGPQSVSRVAPRQSYPEYSDDDDRYTWVDLLIDAIFGIIDAGL